MTDDSPDRDRAQDNIGRRKSERAETTESILADVERHLGEVEYPVSGEELATEYALDEIDLPNETESMGSVLDRLATDQFESATAAREAVSGEITGEAGDRHEANPERDLDRLEEGRGDSLGESGADQF